MKTVSLLSLLVASLLILSCQSKTKTETASTSSDQSEDTLVTNVASYSVMHFCTERLPPPPPSLNIPFSTDTVYETMSETRTDTLIINKLKRVNRPYILSLSGYRWPKQNLKVTFLDGDPEVIRRVTEAAKQWERYCGVRFLFGDFPNPDISISFRYLGAWSFIGIDSQKNRPSMNFGWFIRETDQAELERVVLHEFGHALGFVHEHQRLDANIVWNRPAVYAYYAQPPNNWTENDVNENIFQRYDRTQSNGTAFDPNSIMMYAVPAELTLNRVGFPWPQQLSVQDKQFVSQWYPTLPATPSAGQP